MPTFSGQTAPAAIHCSNCPISFADSWPVGGISKPSYLMASISRLSAGSTRHNARASLAALKHPGSRIEPQLAFLLLVAVTFETLRDEQRANVLFKVGDRRARQVARPPRRSGPSRRQTQLSPRNARLCQSNTVQSHWEVVSVQSSEAAGIPAESQFSMITSPSR